jgi:hypothetical protein
MKMKFGPETIPAEFGENRLRKAGRHSRDVKKLGVFERGVRERNGEILGGGLNMEKRKKGQENKREG